MKAQLTTLILIAVAGCTQPAAPIALRGHEDFSQEKQLASRAVYQPPTLSANASTLHDEVQPVTLVAPTNSIHKEELPPIKAPATARRSEGLIWPVDGAVIQRFGASEEGIRIRASQGEPIFAADAGEVVFVEQAHKGFGRMMIIKHSTGSLTTYGHLSSIKARKYDRVQQGEIIGFVGASGEVREAQLFFAVRKDNQMVDPEGLLPVHVASAH